jgi:hypothetical protein
MTYPKRALCPCCRFLTLDENGGFEICIICWWEDDGQQDKDADKVRGGPNGRYSLTDARKNFADHGHMYDQNQGIQSVEGPSVARRALMEYLRIIGFDPKSANATRLSELLSAEDRNIQNSGE